MTDDFISKFLDIEYFKNHGTIEYFEQKYFYDALAKEQELLRRRVLATEDKNEREELLQEFKTKVKEIYTLAFRAHNFYVEELKYLLPAGYTVRFSHYYTKYLRYRQLFEQLGDGRIIFTTDVLPQSICEEFDINKSLDFVREALQCTWPVIVFELKEMPVGTYKVIEENTVITENCYLGVKSKEGMRAIRRDGEMDRIVITFVHFSKDECNFFSVSPNGKELRNFRWKINR